MQFDVVYWLAVKCFKFWFSKQYCCLRYLSICGNLRMIHSYLK